MFRFIRPLSHTGEGLFLVKIVSDQPISLESLEHVLKQALQSIQINDLLIKSTERIEVSVIKGGSNDFFSIKNRILNRIFFEIYTI